MSDESSGAAAAPARPVLVLTTEPVPLPGCRTTGAGLRAWGLAQSLAGGGLPVVLGSTATGMPQLAAVGELLQVGHVPRTRIGALLADLSPSVVVLQHWGLAADVPELSVPLVLDLDGPHVLERYFWGDGAVDAHMLEKLAALRRADFVLCAGAWQRLYFLPYLMEAGFDPGDAALCPVIPFAVEPVPEVETFATHASSQGPVFVYSGHLLGWQDPSRPIAWLLDEFDAAGCGRLLFIGGAHPQVDASAGRFGELLERLRAHPRVEVREPVPYDELRQILRDCDVALDLMARNLERELAYTSRTVVYLRAGLPVLYNNYSELADKIASAGAGWALDPEDEGEFRSVVRTILRDQAPLAEMSHGALRLAKRHGWDRTGSALVEFCRAPRERPGRNATVLGWTAERLETETLRRTLDAERRAHAALRGRWHVRLAERIRLPRALLRGPAWLLGWFLARKVARVVQPAAPSAAREPRPPAV